MLGRACVSGSILALLHRDRALFFEDSFWGMSDCSGGRLLFSQKREELGPVIRLVPIEN